MRQKIGTQWTILLCVCALLCVCVHGDIYLHSPRGSNNRLDEQTRGRRNANRLFDSQNNNRGGYNVGSVYYYAGSKLQIEWTNQHSCGSENNYCELVLQYMCDDQLRDGATTTTIPSNPMECQGYNCETDLQYGMHEEYDYYLDCETRTRNMGLFTADNNLSRNRDKAKNTRQNNAGTRRGYECPEERDYYPYWHPTPWKDIAVLTNEPERCRYYQEESENVKSRSKCYLSRKALLYVKEQGLTVPNNEEECVQFKVTGGSNVYVGEWRVVPAHGLEAPECRENEFNRDNHLGNTAGGYANTYNWTIPDHLQHQHCVIRMRYNISTADYDPWSTDHAYNRDRKSIYGPSQAAQVPLWKLSSFDDEQEAISRGWVLKNDPQVQLFEGIPSLKLQLAIDTDQYGRTFQDRSHSFAVRSRPSELQDVTIHNLGVRGKRGNIVQVYPAVEYDFVPNTLEMKKDTYVHFQWTGSNTNPHNNDGQGRAGTDRSNVLLQEVESYQEGSEHSGSLSKYGHWGRSYPQDLRNQSFLGLSLEDRTHLAFLSPNQFRGEMSELDDAGTYFDLGPRKVTQSGIYHYMSTRNNNFSNRSQKGKIVVSSSEVTYRTIGRHGGDIELDGGRIKVTVDRGAFDEPQNLRMEVWEAADGEEHLKKQEGHKIGDEFVSSFISISPDDSFATSPSSSHSRITVTLPVSTDSSIRVYRTNAQMRVWTEVHGARVSGGTAEFSTDQGGVYVVAKEANKDAIIAGAVVSVVVVAVIVAATVFYFRRYPEKLHACTRSFRRSV